jgi:hypothetical protein
LFAAFATCSFNSIWECNFVHTAENFRHHACRITLLYIFSSELVTYGCIYIQTCPLDQSAAVRIEEHLNAAV